MSTSNAYCNNANGARDVVTRGDIRALWWAIAKARAGRGDAAGAEQARQTARTYPTLREAQRYGIL